MENPFSLKVGQVFTGIGAGCGVGIGVGQPIPFGSIPALQQIMSAARGATEPFLGVTRYFNSYMTRMGFKNIKAGVGCGIGVGHGFGVGLALKPRVMHQIQSSVVDAVTKMMVNIGITTSVPSLQSSIPGSLPSIVSMQSDTHGSNVETSKHGLMDMLSNTTESTQPPTSYERVRSKPMQNYDLTRSPEVSLGSSSEKVTNTFLKNPLLNKEELELNQLVGTLRSENNLLQVLLRHQQAIEELVEENRKLRQVMMEDLKVSATKLEISSGSRSKSIYPCSDCFECRRRNRKSGR